MPVFIAGQVGEGALNHRVRALDGAPSAGDVIAMRMGERTTTVAAVPPGPVACDRVCGRFRRRQRFQTDRCHATDTRFESRIAVAGWPRKEIDKVPPGPMVSGAAEISTVGTGLNQDNCGARAGRARHRPMP